MKGSSSRGRTRGRKSKARNRKEITMRNPDHYRQGDLGFAKLSTVPDWVAKAQQLRPIDGRLVLARGEATGHDHYVLPDESPGVEAFVKDDGTGSLVLIAPQDITVRHQEHGPLLLPPLVQVEPQVEHDPEGERRVRD